MTKRAKELRVNKKPEKQLIKKDDSVPAPAFDKSLLEIMPCELEEAQFTQYTVIQSRQSIFEPDLTPSDKPNKLMAELE